MAHLRRVPLIAAIAALHVACGGTQEIARYDFAGRTLAVVDYPAPAPVVLTGSYDIDTDNPITAVLDGGSRMAKEIEGRRARARLDSAAVNVDVGHRMSARAFDRAGRYLGTLPVEDAAAADYLFEIYVVRLGIDARESRAAKVFMTAEAVLIDRASGYEVWSLEVDSHDRVTPPVRAGGLIPTDVVTAASLSELRVEHYERALAGLVDLTADHVTNELRESLRRMRRR